MNGYHCSQLSLCNYRQELLSVPPPPNCEEDVHRRIEAVLRCVFPDLLHKPPLHKPVKGFIPNTGLPSLKTLVEYKFLDNAKKVRTIADEILADSRGYVVPGWSNYLFIIYETNRFRTEYEWNALFHSCGLAETSTVIVLCGEEGNLAAP